MTEPAFLTKVELKSCSHLTFLKKTPQNLHAAVAETFDGTQKRWRLDDNDFLWVVSSSLPSSPQSLPGDVESRDLTALQNNLKSGMKVGFRIRITPTRRYTDRSGRRRLSHLSADEDQIAWLRDRQDRLGLAFDQIQIVDKGSEDFLHKEGSGSRTRIQFGWVVMEGVATVSDPAALYESLVSGIGKKAAYGSGLLTIAPVKQ